MSLISFDTYKIYYKLTGSGGVHCKGNWNGVQAPLVGVCMWTRDYALITVNMDGASNKVIVSLEITQLTNYQVTQGTPNYTEGSMVCITWISIEYKRSIDT